MTTRNRFARDLVGGIAVTAALAGLLFAVPATAAPERQNTEWLDLGTQAANEAATAFPFVEDAGQNVWVWWVAPLAWYAGNTWGWDDSRTQGWLREVYDRQTPSGGYGIGEPWDWRGDGTVNPADTTYTITTAWHVGRVLLAGYDEGGVPRERVLEAAIALLDTSQTADDQCISYSNSPYDENMPCVWNINATAAWYLSEAHERGIVPEGREAEMLDKIETWQAYTRANYRADLGGWTYESDDTVLQDPWHNAATVAPMYELDPSWTEPMDAQFTNWPNSTAANADLVLYDCSRITPSLIEYARTHAFPPYDTQRERLQSRSRWAQMGLAVHLTCYDS